MLAEAKRAILSDVKRMSYSLVAKRYGLTRNQIAGIVWRHKNPRDTLLNKTRDGKRSGGQCGRWYGIGPWPLQHLGNTR